MPKYVENADDLNKKYHSTFVKYGGKFAFVTSFLQIDNKNIAVQVTYEKQTVTENYNSDAIEAITFDSMFVNNGDLRSKSSRIMIPATLFQRLPRRQWKRGLSSDNTKLRCPIISLYSSIGRTVDNFDHALTHALLARLDNPVYPSLTEAIKLIDRFEAIALSPAFTLCLSNISRTNYLITNIFGFVAEATDKAIYVKHPPVLQELRDYVSRTNQSVTVEAV